MKMKRGFYAGVDSGGTKCEVTLAAEDLSPLFTKAYKGTHYSLAGAQVFASDISGFIMDSLQRNKLSTRDCVSICVGAAGVREASDRSAVQKLLSKLTGAKVAVTTDAMTALAGTFEGDEGIILISGTGSVLYGMAANKIIRVGGWGRIIGDEGSGYWIGRRALNLVAREFDEKKSRACARSLLSRALDEKFGINKATVNSIIFSKDFPVQSIVPSVTSCASKGCRLSRLIVDEAVEGLFWHVDTFLRLSGRRKPIDLAFTGSVIENDNLISRKLSRKINSTGVVKVVRRRNSPSYGAVLIAAGRFREREII